MIDWTTSKICPLGSGLYDWGFEGVFVSPIVRNALIRGQKYFRTWKSGECSIKNEEVVKYLEENGFVDVYEKNGSHVFLKQDSDNECAISLDISSTIVSLQLLYNSYDKYGNIEKYLFSLLSTLPKESGYLFAIASSNDGLTYTKIGKSGKSLLRENYTDEVLKHYDYCIKQLNSDNPFGRIVILDGVPGCGKSFMIRGLMQELKNTIFILVPPSMVASLGTPSFIPLLLKIKEDLKDEEEKEVDTITLILEDSDEVLAPRRLDNIGGISSVLNISDGLLGGCFDLRVISTTNADVNDLDAAVVRPGRLLKRIAVDPFEKDKANEVLKRLTGKEDVDISSGIENNQSFGLVGLKPREVKKTWTLAEVYQRSNEIMSESK